MFYLVKIKLWKVVKILLSLNNWLFFSTGQRRLNSWLNFLYSGSKQWMWKGGICESGAALLWVHPTWCLLSWCIYVYPHISRRLIGHRLDSATVASRRKCRWTLSKGPWCENGGTVLGVVPPIHRLPPELCQGTTLRRIIWWLKGDHFLVVFSCYKAHLSLLLTHENHLDYTLPLSEFPLAYSKTINEKIWQAIKFFFGLELYAYSFKYFSSPVFL